MNKVGRVTAPLPKACKEGEPCLKCSHWQALAFLSSPLWTRLHWHSLLAGSAATHDERSLPYAKAVAVHGQDFPCPVWPRDLACARDAVDGYRARHIGPVDGCNHARGAREDRQRRTPSMGNLAQRSIGRAFPALQ
jgi:hypothetical protein